LLLSIVVVITSLVVVTPLSKLEVENVVKLLPQIMLFLLPFLLVFLFPFCFFRRPGMWQPGAPNLSSLLLDNRLLDLFITTPSPELSTLSNVPPCRALFWGLVSN
jgi:hypothetical protein